MQILKVLMIPAALAITPATGMAATTPPSANAPERATTGVETTPVYHRGYWHDRYYYRPHRPHWRGYYYYAPRCYWSRYWHRTVCR